MLEELDELTALVADVVELARGTKLGEHDDVRLDQIVESVVERAARARPGSASSCRPRRSSYAAIRSGSSGRCPISWTTL